MMDSRNSDLPIETPMNLLVDIYNLAGFPAAARIPPFKYRYPIGPEFALDLANHLLTRGIAAERLDLDTGEACRVDPGVAITGAGDHMYALYKNAEEWVFIFSNDIDWGILFSNSPLTDSIEFPELQIAKANFIDSLKSRTGEDSLYYNTEILSKWAEIAGVDL
jgi:hypothetical protein